MSRRKKQQEELFDQMPLPQHLRTPEFIQVWNDFREFRREIRKPLTPTNERYLLLKLMRYDEVTARAMVVQSIERRWQGIFEVQQRTSLPSYRARDAVTSEDIQRVTHQIYNEARNTH